MADHLDTDDVLAGLLQVDVLEQEEAAVDPLEPDGAEAAIC